MTRNRNSGRPSRRSHSLFVVACKDFEDSKIDFQVLPAAMLSRSWHIASTCESVSA